MPYKMIHKDIGINDKLGVTTKVYEVDEIIQEDEEWRAKVGKRFMERGKAIKIDAETVIPMQKDNDALPSDVEPHSDISPSKKIKKVLKTIKAIKTIKSKK